MRKTNYLLAIVIASLSVWLVLFFASVLKWQSAERVSNFVAQIEFIFQILTLITFVNLYKQIKQQDRTIMIWLGIVCLGLFLDDLAFYWAVYFPKQYVLSASFSIFIIGFIPYLMWLLSLIIFLSALLAKDIFNKEFFIKTFPCLFIFNVIVMILFYTSLQEKFGNLSWESLTHIISFGLEFIIFDLAVLALIYAESLGFILILAGFIVLITGDIFFNYSFVTQTDMLLGSAEQLWFLGLIITWFGLLTINKNKQYAMKAWFSPNTIKSSMAFWTFSISSIGFLLFFIIGYSFKIINHSVFLILPFFIMLYSILIVALSIYMGKRFELPFKKLANNVDALLIKNDKNLLDNNFTIEEFKFLQSVIIESYDSKEERDKAKKELGAIVAQVAHDIWAPVSSISAATNGKFRDTFEAKKVINSATKRLKDIASNLLLIHKGIAVEGKNNSQLMTENLFLILDMLISEKRYEYSAHKIKLNFTYEQNVVDAFSKIYLAEFNRLISNVINNAVEAMNFTGEVNITLSVHNEFITIKISDNGHGIPSHILSEVTKEGFSYNKKEGAGLGLFYAKNQIDRIHGTFTIDSTENVGTSVIIQLNRANIPQWFCREIRVSKSDDLIIILDDDQCVHDLWKIQLNKNGLHNICDFYNEEDIEKNKEIVSLAKLILVDYDLSSSEKSGLDLINEYDLQKKSILVTNNFYTNEIRENCKKIGMKLLPKPFISDINFKINREVKNLIFIDDNESIKMAWEFALDIKGVQVHAYSSVAEFENEKQDFALDTSIYIDSNLGENIKGEEYAKSLNEQGFKEIYLVTGNDAESFPYMPWLAGIQDKTPPYYL